MSDIIGHGGFPISMNHKQLVLSKGPLAFYPLDTGLANAMDTGGSVASSATVWNGSNDSTALVFFRKGQGLCNGYQGICQVKNSNGYIEVPAFGMFNTLGEDREVSMEFYYSGEVAQTNTKENTAFWRYQSLTTEAEMSFAAGNIVLRLKLASANKAISTSLRVYSGKPNRPKQIVINWSPSYVAFSVDGEQSDPLDISEYEWSSTTTNGGGGVIRLLGVGTSSTTYRKFNQFQAVSFFPRLLKKEEIDELREAAFGDNNAYGPINFYDGEFIECNGQNIPRQGQWTIETPEDFAEHVTVFGTKPNDGIRWTGMTAPEISSDERPPPDPAPYITVENNRQVLDMFASNKYVIFDGISEVVNADVCGITVTNLGSGGYTAKKYLASFQAGNIFLGVYTQSQNVYYELTDEATGETSSGTVLTGIDTWSATGITYIGISKRTNELVIGDGSASAVYTTIYSTATKISLPSAPIFFGACRIGVGHDLREDLSTTTTRHSVKFFQIRFASVDSPSETRWECQLSYNTQTNAQAGFAYFGPIYLKYAIPAELVCDYNGTTTAPGSIVSYIDSDNYGYYTQYQYFGPDPLSGYTYGGTGPAHGMPGMRVVKIPYTTDVTNGYFAAVFNPTIQGAPGLFPTIKSYELVSYRHNASGYAEIIDPRSKYTLESYQYMTIPQDDVNPHKRGLGDGLRNIQGQSRIVVPSTDTIYAMSFMVWADSDPSVYDLNSTNYTLRELVKITGGSATENLKVRGVLSGTKYNAVDVIRSLSTTEVYINGVNPGWTGAEPTTTGIFPTNQWTHVLLIFTTPITGGATITFDKASGDSGGLRSDFEVTNAYTDIALFTNGTKIPGTLAGRDIMANRLSAPYIGDDTDKINYNETVTVKTGDGFTLESSKVWRPLVD